MGEGRYREMRDGSSKMRNVDDVGILGWCVVDKIWGDCIVSNDGFRVGL